MLLELLVRKNVWNYVKSLPHEEETDILDNHNLRLDKNENPYNEPLNRFPDPNQTKLKHFVAAQRKVDVQNIFFSNGTDELTDCIIRIFCRPQIDNIVTVEPTRSIYRKCAVLNDVEYRTVKLDDTFKLSPEKILKRCDNNTKAIFICSPNNPTGNIFDVDDVEQVVKKAESIVVVDESFADFTDARSFDSLLQRYPNLIVIHSFSYAWACAALRLGMAFANKEVVRLMNVVGHPYNVDVLTQQMVVKVFDNKDVFYNRLLEIRKELDSTMRALQELPWVVKVYPSVTNFFIVKVKDADHVCRYLKENGIYVKKLNTKSPVDNCIRITIGKKEDNAVLIAALRNYPSA